MTDRDLVVALILGVLLPGLLSRPEFLSRHPMSDYVRARWVYGYSVFAFAAATFIYFSGEALLKPPGGFSSEAAHALVGAGMLLLALLLAHHLPPLFATARPRRVRTLQAALAVVLGVLLGGYFAADTLWPLADGKMPPIAVGAWMVTLVLAYVAACWFSGLSPRMRQDLYVWRSRRRRRASRAATGTPAATGQGNRRRPRVAPSRRSSTMK